MPERKRYKSMRKSRMSMQSVVKQTDGPEWAGDSRASLTVPSTTTLYSTTVTTGVISSAFELDPTSNVKNWSSRFETVFQEYRVRRATVRIRPLTTATGVSKFFFTRTNNVSATEALETPGRVISNSQANSGSIIQMRYISKDFATMEWSSINSSPNTPFFNIYTDLAN